MTTASPATSSSQESPLYTPHSCWQVGLPADVAAEIAWFVTGEDEVNLGRTCRFWHSVIRDSARQGSIRAHLMSLSVREVLRMGKMVHIAMNPEVYLLSSMAVNDLFKKNSGGATALVRDMRLARWFLSLPACGGVASARQAKLRVSVHSRSRCTADTFAAMLDDRYFCTDMMCSAMYGALRTAHGCACLAAVEREIVARNPVLLQTYPVSTAARVLLPFSFYAAYPILLACVKSMEFDPGSATRIACCSIAAVMPNRHRNDWITTSVSSCIVRMLSRVPKRDSEPFLDYVFRRALVEGSVTLDDYRQNQLLFKEVLFDEGMHHCHVPRFRDVVYDWVSFSSIETMGMHPLVAASVADQMGPNACADRRCKLILRHDNAKAFIHAIRTHHTSNEQALSHLVRRAAESCAASCFASLINLLRSAEVDAVVSQKVLNGTVTQLLPQSPRMLFVIYDSLDGIACDTSLVETPSSKPTPSIMPADGRTLHDPRMIAAAMRCHVPLPIQYAVHKTVTDDAVSMRTVLSLLATAFVSPTPGPMWPIIAEIRKTVIRYSDPLYGFNNRASVLFSLCARCAAGDYAPLHASIVSSECINMPLVSAVTASQSRKRLRVASR